MFLASVGVRREEWRENSGGQASSASRRMYLEISGATMPWSELVRIAVSSMTGFGPGACTGGRWIAGTHPIPARSHEEEIVAES